MRDPYMTKDDRREVRAAAGYGVRWLLAGIVLLLLIGWALWAIGVGTSDIRGKGNAIKTKNSATNRIAAQERFEDRYADIQAASLRIDTMAAALKANPDDVTARVNATGAITYCQQAVSEYNADARKYTAAQFRANDLPATIDATEACKENLT